jgi:MFS family permease
VPGRSEARRGALRAALRHRDFRLLVGSQAISATGDWLYGVALLVYVYDRTHSATWLAAASILRFLPYVLLSTFGGVLADRYDRRRLMITIDAARGILMALATVVVLTDGAAFLIIAITTVSTAFNTAYLPCVQASTPAVVGEEDLAGANAVVSIVDNVALALGPALAGLLLLGGHTSLAFATNGVSFFASMVLVALIRTPLSVVPDQSDDEQQGSLQERLRAGFAAMTSSTIVLLVALNVALTFAYGMELVLHPIVSEQLLHKGEDGLAFMYAALGVGGIVAAALIGRVSAAPRQAGLLVFSSIVAAGPIMALALVHRPWIAYLLLVIEGAAVIVADVLALTMLQRIVSREVLGRVMGIQHTLMITGMLLGSGLAPLIVAVGGVKSGLVVAGGLLGCFAFATLPRAREVDRATAARAAELAERVTLLSRAGMFEAAAPPTVEALAASLVAERLTAHTVVVREGDDPDDMWIVATGTLAVTSRGEAGGEPVEVAHLGPGDYFGEIGLLRDMPRTATVTTIEDCVLWRLPGAEFLRIVNDGTALSTNLRTRMVARLARTHASRLAETP